MLFYLECAIILTESLIPSTTSEDNFRVLVYFSAATIFLAVDSCSSIIIAVCTAFSAQIVRQELIIKRDEEDNERAQHIFEYLFTVMLVFIITTLFWVALRYIVRL